MPAQPLLKRPSLIKVPLPNLFFFAKRLILSTKYILCLTEPAVPPNLALPASGALAIFSINRVKREVGAIATMLFIPTLPPQR